ncbi:MAG: hypothetical protein QXU11_11930 [Thermoproteota archaeon]
MEIKINSGKKEEDLIRNFTEFEADYLPIEKDRLILFVIDYLYSKNIEVTFDKLTVAAFKLFPKKFSLIGFPEYPDAKTVNDCVFLHCVKTKGWASGNAQTGYRITEKGKYFLEETKKMLEGKIKITRKYGTVPRRKEVTFINLLKKTQAYRKYLQNKKEEISYSEILEALKMPSHSSKEALEKNFEKYFTYASKINDESVIKFLEFVQRKLRGIER